MGPSAHEADDFRPTRELGDDFKIPGGYADEHWRNEHQRINDKIKAREEAASKAEEDARIKAEEEAKRKAEELKRLAEEARPKSLWDKHGWPVNKKDSKVE